MREADRIRGSYIATFATIEEQVGILLSGYFHHQHRGATGLFRSFFLDGLSFGRMVELVTKIGEEVDVDVTEWTRLARAANKERGYFAHSPFWVIGVDPSQYIFANLGLTRKSPHGPFLGQDQLTEWFARLGALFDETTRITELILDAIGFPKPEPFEES